MPLLDELGYVPGDGRAADVVHAIISRRHAARSTVITTNLAFNQWGNVALIAQVREVRRYWNIIRRRAYSR